MYVCIKLKQFARQLGISYSPPEALLQEQSVPQLQSSTFTRVYQKKNQNETPNPDSHAKYLDLVISGGRSKSTKIQLIKQDALVRFLFLKIPKTKGLLQTF